MRITSKGQVTIPKEVRDKAGIDQKTELEVTFRDGVVVIEKIRADEGVKRRREREFADWLKRVHGTADSGLTADQILDETRGPFNDLDPR
jgi:AbrB family looped-hinge helix DNA binding protein